MCVCDFVLFIYSYICVCLDGCIGIDRVGRQNMHKLGVEIKSFIVD